MLERGMLGSDFCYEERGGEDTAADGGLEGEGVDLLWHLGNIKMFKGNIGSK